MNVEQAASSVLPNEWQMESVLQSMQDMRVVKRVIRMKGLFGVGCLIYPKGMLADLYPATADAAMLPAKHFTA